MKAIFTRRMVWILPLLLAAALAAANEPLEVELTLSAHRFEPAELRVPADRKIKLIVHNLDASAEEFESYELNREKIVGSNSTISIWVGPLSPGRYPFFGEFNPDTAQGVLLVE
ncbi:MAG: cupredoxin domain-containing protein [Gammaproteobacteria bacterium]|jgi:hypothetical protein|nr:cupredoxin domain-containing protein [Gammaproteobacteria bacterium]